MLKYLVPDWLNILLKSYTTQIAGLGIVAQVILDYGLSITLPWYVNVGLLGLILVGRLVAQPTISAPPKEDDPDGQIPLGI